MKTFQFVYSLPNHPTTSGRDRKYTELVEAETKNEAYEQFRADHPFRTYVWSDSEVSNG